MSNDGVVGFGYLQARVQARYAQLTCKDVWLKLGAIDDFNAYLEESRATSLAPLIAGISSQSDSHDIDLLVRRFFLQQVTELSTWMPQAWRPATLWLQWLPDIPILSYLLEEQRPAIWMYHDKRLSLMLEDQGVLVEQNLEKGGAGCLITEGTSAASMLRMWLQHWPTLWPVLSHHFRFGIEALIQLIREEQVQFSSLATDQTWAARDNLQQTLKLFFRRNLLQPATAFSYLALMSLQLERVRAELLQRLLFPQRSLIL
ncbi:MAG: hypothetical protein GY694_00955 [Gammaproteobacteria bacterium]|nr:hypothetical protein [Gammaproteobacteria bacterium]